MKEKEILDFFTKQSSEFMAGVLRIKETLLDEHKMIEMERGSVLKTYNTTQAAEILNLKKETVLAHARKGSLKGSKLGSIWVFTEDNIKQFLDENINSP